ncbi:MAG: V-type ATP synthase subunit D [Chlamydiae bacterium GWC2_50_10]|nr:MAG: V-type ATP synthase subunit D [Chlamydiae bacterium GWA2_50_15]OGN53772.1 MAG: V-type ATP synthase subunit D [Chlamydiae bacterium GWC2_50_10]OGN57757.1 MAG: V-type ATP synthase subunit D [Chlamydiae bacterium RIFCSPHIGHO2_02_FULL_49_29]OGN62620.1 MAG: V-type ATP synthase subunit D [Chlamydiae bacterium RIFCSPHIGHO2_12_FULL_49_32]OGN68232.1 MAG: V-type ATP synthase subunit D [Chlamydiae bacterium RIFCSPLOWO2_02_FULL_49_12]OGN72873.1 MAG: V-type ATP synthase subunit D [Chlamydiae bacter
MSLKLTKTELRSQEVRFHQLQRYLPTLQLKKALLQSEINRAALELHSLESHFDVSVEKVELFAALLTAPYASLLFKAVQIKEMKLDYENIAGIEIPFLEEIIFESVSFPLFATPSWMEYAIYELKELVLYREQIALAKRRKSALEKELREVSIRVNLFEKILIPRALKNIKRIRVFLGDQQLAAVCQAKVSKEKILERKLIAVV